MWRFFVLDVGYNIRQETLGNEKFFQGVLVFGDDKLET